MATIKKRNGKFVVIYDYTDQFGKRKQKWVTCRTEDEAKKAKLEVELNKLKNNFIIPTALTVGSFFKEFISIYGKANWKHRTYETNISTINNHIIPYIGHLHLQNLSPRDVELMYNTLRTKKIGGIKAQGNDDSDLPCLSSTTLRYIHIILKKAMQKAVQWKYIETNPVICDAPKANKPDRTIWDEDTFMNALDEITDNDILHLAVHIAFACSLRVGEVMGLTWDCVDLERKEIYINKGILRVSKEALNELPKDEIIFIFPETIKNSKSLLVLSKPKTKSSIRRIFITEPLKKELIRRKEKVERDKLYYGERYSDYNLVFCFEDGRAIEAKRCSKWFKKWQKQLEFPLPELDFHEIRHSSVTYKLGISDSDIKSIQGDTGHATPTMVTNQYGHIQDKRRIALTKKFEDDFYKKKEKPKKETSQIAYNAIMEQIGNDPVLQEKILSAIIAHNADKF
jgi:integrase